MSKRDRFIFFSLVAGAAILRLITLADRPFDGDEGVIALVADGSIGEIWEGVSRDVHPPLYHLLVAGSMVLFGVSEWSVRLVGVLAGIGLVALAPKLFATFLGSTHSTPLRAGPWVPGSIFMLALATSPYLVNLSQDARMYSLLVALSVASWVVLYRLVTNGKDGWRLSLLHALLALALVWTHHIGWLIVALEGLVVFIWHRDVVLKRTKYVLGALAVFMLGYLPLLPITIAQVQGRLAEQSLGASLVDRVSGIVGAIYRMLAGRTFLDLNPGSLMQVLSTDPIGFAAFLFTLIIPAFLVLVGFITRARAGTTPPLSLPKSPSSKSEHFASVPGGTSSEVLRGDSCEVKEPRPWRKEALFVIVISLVVALVIGTIGAQAGRYLSYLAPLVLGFLTIGLLRLWPHWSGKAAAIVVALTFMAGLWTQSARHNQSDGLDAYARAILSNKQSGDVVLLRGGFGGGESWAFEYYLSRASYTSQESPPQHFRGGPGAGTLPTFDLYGEYDVRKSNLDELRAVNPASKVVELLESYNRVWFFDQTYANDPLAALDDRYAIESTVVGLDKEHKSLTLMLVQRQPETRQPDYQ